MMVTNTPRKAGKPASINMLIASRMAELGLTDQDASAMLDVTQPTITRWRLGRSTPQDRHVSVVAKFLKMSQAEVRAAIARADKPVEHGSVRPGTLGHLLRRLENERGIPAAEAWVQYGIDKSRYYRLRSDLSAPRPTDIPALALKLGISEEEVVLAAYRTELWRADQGH